MHITSGICTQIVAAVKVALMPLYEMIPVLVSDDKQMLSFTIVLSEVSVHGHKLYMQLLSLTN